MANDKIDFTGMSKWERNILKREMEVELNEMEKLTEDKKQPIIKFKKLNEKAVIPQYQTKGAAAFDLHTIVEQPNVMGKIVDSFSLMPGERMLMKTGLAVSTGKGYKLDITPRSGLAMKHGITIVNSPGKIDEDYRGEIMIVLHNSGSEPFPVKNGDRIAQAEHVPVIRSEIIEVDDLDETERGAGGFGSTGC